VIVRPVAERSAEPEYDFTIPARVEVPAGAKYRPTVRSHTPAGRSLLATARFANPVCLRK